MLKKKFFLLFIFANLALSIGARLPIKMAPLVQATAETLKGYGEIVLPEAFDTYPVSVVTWPAPGWRPVASGTGNEGGYAQGSFTMLWKGNRLFAKNTAVGRMYLTGWSTHPDDASTLPTVKEKDRKYVVTFEANYHPDGGQLVVPHKQEPFVALLALPGDDVTPDDFVAFYCDGTFGIHINPNVWHQPFFPVKNEGTFSDKQGRVHACIAVNFPEEFNCYLGVPLCCSE